MEKKMSTRFPWIGLLFALAAMSGLLLIGCWGNQVKNITPTEAHLQSRVKEVADAEQDLTNALKRADDGHSATSLSILLQRLKRLELVIFDEYALLSKAHQVGHLPSAQEYGRQINALETVQQALIEAINVPLQTLLNEDLSPAKQPDPRIRQEGLEVINSGANDIFSTFKQGYRTEIIEALKVRKEEETLVELRLLMESILETLSRNG